MAFQPDQPVQPLDDDLNRIAKATQLLIRVEQPIVNYLDKLPGWESPEYIFAGIRTKRLVDAVTLADSIVMALTTDARMTGDLDKQRTAHQFTARAYVIREEIENRRLAAGGDALVGF